MADIVLYDIRVNGHESADALYYSGKGRCTGMKQADYDIEWSVVSQPASTGTALMAAMKQAAVDAAADRGFTVGALDKVTLLGSPTAL